MQPWRGLPRFAAKKIAALRAAILARPEFDSLDNLLRQRIEFEERLVEFLHEIRHPLAGLIAPPVLLVPATPENSIINI